MPDYTSILRRSISALPESTPEVREAVYQRARAALARQLTAVDPPLTTREIERQHQELEEAVVRLEAELAPQSEQEAEEPQAERPSSPPPPAARSLAPVPAARTSSLRDDETRQAAEDGYEDDNDRDLDEEDDEEDYEDGEPRSRLPLVAGLLVALLVIGGAAALGFTQREALMSFLGFSEPAEVETAAAPAATAAAGEDAEPQDAAPAAPAPTELAKRPDRLTNGDDPAASEPPPAAEAPPPPPANPDEPPVTGEALAEAPPPPPAAEPPPPGDQQTAAVGQPGQSIVAQRAIYYFQGAEGSAGQATDGTVAWAQINKDNGPAVQAVLRLEERDVTATVTISRNSDSTLPASHLVEIQFAGEFGPSPIQRVPALVLKQTEQARGEPLNGAAVPVTDELFWIALADNEEQIRRNLQLLREGSWFDIPVLFNDGTRALLTFEKGIPGDKVFETVMSTWTPS